MRLSNWSLVTPASSHLLSFVLLNVSRQSLQRAQEIASHSTFRFQVQAIALSVELIPRRHEFREPMTVWPVRTRYLKLQEHYGHRVMPALQWKGKDVAIRHFEKLHKEQQELLEGDMFQNALKALLPSFPALKTFVTTSIRRVGHHPDLTMESTSLPFDSKFGYEDQARLSGELQTLRTYWASIDPVPTNVFAPALVHHVLQGCGSRLTQLGLDCFNWRFFLSPQFQQSLDQRVFSSLEEFELRWNGYDWGNQKRREDEERKGNLELLRTHVVQLLLAAPRLRLLSISLHKVGRHYLFELDKAVDRFTMNCAQMFASHTWNYLTGLNLGNVDIDASIFSFLARHKLRDLILGNMILVEPGDDWLSFLNGFRKTIALNTSDSGDGSL